MTDEMNPICDASGWFDDAKLVRSLPLHMRVYAAYSRAVVNRTTGVVRGGSFIFRQLRRLTPLLRLPSEARIRVGPHVAFVDLTDQRVLWVFDELYGRGDEFRLLNKLLRPGDTFLDIGANHGSFSILAGPIVGRSGFVVAVEPQPRLAQMVERSLAAAGCSPYQIHAVALGNDDGQVLLHIPWSGSGSASRFSNFAPGRHRCRIQVPLRRADSLLRWREYPGRIMVKLDIEGSELAFLQGADAFLRERQPVILFELNPDSAGVAGHSVTVLLDAFEKLGYSRFAELQSYPHSIPKTDVDTTVQRNLLALPEG